MTTRIAIFGRDFTSKYEKQIQKLFDTLNSSGNYEICCYKPFYEFLSNKKLNLRCESFFTQKDDLHEFKPKVLLSIGGDGTLLHASYFVLGSKIHILGINTGRLGFLSSITFDEIEKVIPKINEEETYIENRTVLEVIGHEDIFKDENFALNELTVSRRDISSMIMITAYLDGEFLNTYWCDGLIISTPTGSTAYSLSCGGPIVMIGSDVFVVTPIAPHNLNVRPLIVPDTSKLTLKISGRNESCLVSLDSRTYILNKEIEITVQKHARKIKLIRLNEHSYLKTLREKMNWGLDKRN